jgi:hypothetical protein
MKRINHSNVANYLLAGTPIRRAIIVKHSQEIGGLCSVDDLRKLREMDGDGDQDDDQDDAERAVDPRGSWVQRAAAHVATLNGSGMTAREFAAETERQRAAQDYVDAIRADRIDAGVTTAHQAEQDRDGDADDLEWTADDERTLAILEAMAVDSPAIRELLDDMHSRDLDRACESLRCELGIKA